MRKKITGILFTIITIGSLYFMSKGLVGISLAYTLIGLHIVRLFIEIAALRVFADKATMIREDIRVEIGRKGTHLLLGLVTVPMIYWSFKGTIHLPIMTSIILLIIFIADKIGFAKKIATREGNGDDNVGSVYYFALGFLINGIISLFVPKYTVCVLLGVMALAIGDPNACFIGRLFGKHKLYKNKSLEGFIGFVIGATIAMYLATGLSLLHLVVIAICGATAELYSDNYDNISIQLVTALVAFIIL